MTIHRNQHEPSLPFHALAERCSALDLELIRMVMALPDRVRATLLAFLHLSQDDSERMSADLAVGQGEEVHLVLAASSREAACDVS